MELNTALLEHWIGAGSYPDSWGIRKEVVPGNSWCCQAVPLAFWGSSWAISYYIALLLVGCYHFFSVNCCFILSAGCKAEMYRKHTDSVWWSPLQDGLHGLCAGLLSVPSWCFNCSLMSHCIIRICYYGCFAEACRLWLLVFLWMRGHSPLPLAPFWIFFCLVTSTSLMLIVNIRAGMYRWKNVSFLLLVTIFIHRFSFSCLCFPKFI